MYELMALHALTSFSW